MTSKDNSEVQLEYDNSIPQEPGLTPMGFTMVAEIVEAAAKGIQDDWTSQDTLHVKALEVFRDEEEQGHSLAIPLVWDAIDHLIVKPGQYTDYDKFKYRLLGLIGTLEGIAEVLVAAESCVEIGPLCAAPIIHGLDQMGTNGLQLLDGTPKNTATWHAIKGLDEFAGDSPEAAEKFATGVELTANWKDTFQINRIKNNLSLAETLSHGNLADPKDLIDVAKKTGYNGKELAKEITKSTLPSDTDSSRIENVSKTTGAAQVTKFPLSTRLTITEPSDVDQIAQKLTGKNNSKSYSPQPRKEKLVLNEKSQLYKELFEEDTYGSKTLNLHGSVVVGVDAKTLATAVSEAFRANKDPIKGWLGNYYFWDAEPPLGSYGPTFTYTHPEDVLLKISRDKTVRSYKKVEYKIKRICEYKRTEREPGGGFMHVMVPVPRLTLWGGSRYDLDNEAYFIIMTPIE